MVAGRGQRHMDQRFSTRPSRHPTRNGTAFTGAQRVALLAAFALLTMLRLPQVWLHGRFLDEEGAVFLAFAWHRPAWTALWRPFGGYLNIGANGATLLVATLVRAGVVSLEHAPWVTMTIALAFQTVPAALLLTSRSPWLRDRKAVLACLTIVAISPMTEEVFANVLHIQYHLALAAALILALDVPQSARGRIASLALLLLGPLCGPGAIVLLPLFALRAAMDRDRARAGQFLALGLGAAVQMLVFYTHNAARGHGPDAVMLVNMLFVRLAVMSYASAPVALHYIALLDGWHAAAGAAWWVATGLATAWFFGLVAFAVIDGLDAAAWLILSGLLLAVLSYGPGMVAVPSNLWFDFWVSERYDFLPITLIGIGMVARAMTPGRRLRRLAGGLCIALLVSGALTFAQPYYELASGPDWAAQVALWRRDHNHLLVAWTPSWRIDLSDHDRACGPADPAQARASDPPYCEGPWVLRMLQTSRRQLAPLKL